jgi:CRISPR-associated protein Csm3
MKSGLMAFTEGNPVSFKAIKNLQDAELKSKGEKILKLFGAGGAEAGEIAAQDIGPTRVSFADCPLTPQWREEALKNNLSFTEVKSETAIDRIQGTAATGTLRQMERVPAGAEFSFTVTLKILDQDGRELEDLLLLGLKLLTLDALGGCGSRGYGRIELEFHDQNIKKKFDGITPFAGEG